MTREAALARMAEIERELARLETQDIPASEQQVANLSRLPMTGGAFMPPTRQTIGEESMAEAEAIQREKMRDLGKASLRYGVPLAAGIAAGPVTGLAALARTALIGGTAAGAGEAGAQAIGKYSLGEEYRPREITGAAIRGTAPFLKGTSGLGTLFKTAGAAGTAGVLGGAAEGTVTDVGSAAKEFGISAGLAGGPTAAGEFLGATGKALGTMAERAGILEKAGVTPLVTDVMPQFAAFAQRAQSKLGSGQLRQLEENQLRQIEERAKQMGESKGFQMSNRSTRMRLRF